MVGSGCGRRRHRLGFGWLWWQRKSEQRHHEAPDFLEPYDLNSFECFADSYNAAGTDHRGTSRVRCPTGVSGHLASGRVRPIPHG
jgi:hypothetical protein